MLCPAAVLSQDGAGAPIPIPPDAGGETVTGPTDAQVRTDQLDAAAEQAVEDAAANLSYYNPIDTYAFQLSLLFIGFGLVVIALQLVAMRRLPNLTADDVARNCAITLVVVSSVALLVSGYSSAQVAPAFGLFGTIVGYLLGRAGMTRGKGEDDAPTPR